MSSLIGQDPAAEQALIEVLTTTLCPTSWKKGGGAGVIAPLRADGLHVLVIAPTEAVHGQIEQLLKILLADRTGPAPAAKR